MSEIGTVRVNLLPDSVKLRAALAVLGETFAGMADYLHECATKVDSAIGQLEQMDNAPVPAEDAE